MEMKQIKLSCISQLAGGKEKTSIHMEFLGIETDHMNAEGQRQPDSPDYNTTQSNSFRVVIEDLVNDDTPEQISIFFFNYFLSH